MFTREWFDLHMPCAALRKVVFKLTDLDTCEEVFVKNTLEWLVNFQESDRFPSSPDWRKDFPLGSCYSIRFSGIHFKGSLDYLTAEGWPSGTTCWWSRVEEGSHYIVTAETVELLLMRIVVVIEALKIFRSENPHTRRRLTDIIDCLMNRIYTK